jgi:lambda family phage portal protein
MSRRVRLPKPNLFERSIGAVFPAYASKVYQTRVAFAMAESYTGASRSRRALAGWSVSSGDADADTLPYLEDLRERGRDIDRNNPIATGAINTKITSIVGTGLSLQPRISRDILGMTDEAATAWEHQTEAEFKLWSKECDIERILNFETIQPLCYRSSLVNGDVLITTPYKKYPGQIYGTKIQLIEADRLCNADNAQDSAALSGGVERDTDGAVVRYHVLLSHPGSRYTTTAKWTKIDAFGKDGRRNAWLLFDKRRLGQNRGVPDLSPVIETLKQLGRYIDSEAMATLIASFFTVFIKGGDGQGINVGPDLGNKKTDTDFRMGNGNILELNQGEEIEIANPGRPNTGFEGFVTALCRYIGAAIELPYEVLLKTFNASYSASQASLLEAWRYFMGRRKFLADNFCRPLYELFLTEAVASGRIAAPGFLTGDALIREAWLGSDWIGDARGHIREDVAINASKAKIDAGLSNEAIEIMALTGRDREQVYDQRKKEIDQRRADKMMPADKLPPKQGPVQP